MPRRGHAGSRRDVACAPAPWPCRYPRDRNPAIQFYCHDPNDVLAHRVRPCKEALNNEALHRSKQSQPGSYGTGDLWIDSPSIAAPLNLHVSAQLGEWPADRPEEVPADATSDRWWNNNGWSSNIMAYGGLRSRGERTTPRFRPAEGREFQLAKERFGRGEWRLRLSLSGVASAEGGLTTIHLPSQTSEPPIEVEVF